MYSKGFQLIKIVVVASTAADAKTNMQTGFDYPQQFIYVAFMKERPIVNE